MNRGAWWATVHRVAKSQTPLSNSRTPINYEMTMIQYPGHISQTAKQENRHLFPPAVPTTVLPESLLLKAADSNSACRDAEGMLCAMGMIVAEMQSPSGSTSPAHEQRSGEMFLPWEWVIISPSFLEQVKSSLHSKDSLL